jgi:hypothetical protein
MITQSAIIFFAVNIAAGESTIYFQHIGHLNPSPSFGHIHFAIDTKIIANHMTNIKEAIEHVRKLVKEHAHPTLQTKADNFLKRAHLDINSIISDFKDTKSILQGSQPDRSRTKRFLGILFAMGSLTMSLFNQAEIIHLQGAVSDLATRQNHIVDILQEHEVAIHALQHDVTTIRDSFTQIANLVSENHASSLIHDTELQITMAVSEIRRTLSCLQGGIQLLLSNRAPICFLDTSLLRKSLDNLSTKAKSHNLEILDSSISSFMQYETSFLISHNQIHIFTHVPLRNKQNSLDLLKFNNAPLQISGGTAIQLAPTETILAIGKDNLHTTITRQELDHYLKYGQNFFSDSALTLNRRINMTCLGAIYSQDFSQLWKICPLQFLKTSETLTKIASNKFIFYTSTPQTIQMTCQDGTTHIAVEHTHQLEMPPDCTFKTADHIIQTGHNIVMEQKIKQWPTNWNISQLLFDISPQDLESYIKDIHLESHPPTTPRDIKHLLQMNTGVMGTWTIYIVLVLAAAVIIIFSFLGYRYFTIRKQFKNSRPPLPPKTMGDNNETRDNAS